MSNINAIFQSLRCPNCDTFFNRTFNLERPLTTCSERVKNISPRNVYQILETLFGKLDSLGIMYTSQQKLFKNLAKFDFEPVCVQEESFKDKKTTTWIGKHDPISVSISSNLVEEPIFLHNSDPDHLVSAFIGTPEGLASESKAQMKLLFLDIETTIKIKLGSFLEKLTEGHIRREHARFDMSQDECDDEIYASTQFLQIHTNQIIDLEEHLELYCSVLPVFRFNSAENDLNLTNPICYPIVLTNQTLDPLSSRKRTSSSRSILVIFS